MDTPKLPFSPIRKGGNLVFVSGQIGLKDGKVVGGGVIAETEQAVLNVASKLADADATLDDALDVTAFLVSPADYEPFNAMYAKLFREPYPTRTCIFVSALPLGAQVELKVIAKAKGNT